MRIKKTVADRTTRDMPSVIGWVSADTILRGKIRLVQRWGIWFSVEGDLRFGSHHQMLRAAERLILRTKLPVRFSQGFNPRPAVSLPCPKPVGISACRELLLVELDPWAEGDVQWLPQEILRIVRSQALADMDVIDAQPLPPTPAYRPVRAWYDMDVTADESVILAERLAQIHKLTSWQVLRRPCEDKSARPAKSLDLRNFIESLELEGGRLCWQSVPYADIWARPAELLGFVGLDERADLARVVRRQIRFDPHIETLQSEGSFQSPN